MSKLLTSRLISQDLVDYLVANQGAEVQAHSVNTNAINLLTDDGVLITIATPRHAIMPMGVIVNNALDFSWPIKVGDRVILEKNALTLTDATSIIALSGAERWNPNPILTGQLRSRIILKHLCCGLVEWLASQPKIGLLPLLPRLTAHRVVSNVEIDDVYSRYIVADLRQFVAELKDLNWQAALSMAKKLVGFGIGSTPSCDDFLTAYLVVLSIAHALQPKSYTWVSEFNQGIVALANNRTTLISAQMLKHAASGKITRSHQHLIHACLYDTEVKFIDLVEEVSQAGSSSGMDFLLGLTCALDWFAENVIIRHTEGGMEQVEQLLQPVTII